MEILIKRITHKPYSVGHLYINNKYFCDTLEPPYFGTNNKMNVTEILATKKGNTAIPTGEYTICLEHYSPKFGNRSWAKCCNGKIPTIEMDNHKDVIGFSRVLIHVGNVASQYGKSDTMACILVGYNKVKGKLINSIDTFKRLISTLKEAKDNNEKITLTIQ